MAELANLVVLAAAQDVDQVAHAEPLATAVHAAQRLLRGHAGIPGIGWLQAIVAVAARLRIGFAEPGQQHLAAALHGFAVAQQVVELGAFQRLALFARLGLLDHLLEQHHVAQAVAEPGFGRFAVAAGTAGFLVIAFHRLGQVGMRHEAHVGLVDAHAEGDGGAHHDAVFAQESALVGRAHLGRQAGVVGQSVHALLAQELGGFLDLASRHAVDDARFIAVAAQEIQQLALGVVLLHHGVADVGPVEGADEVLGIGQVQPLGDLALGRRVGGGGQRDARHVRPALVQNGELAVFRAEIVAPLRDAMGFVDGEQGNAAARQQGQETAGEQPLGRDVQQFQLAGGQLALYPGGGFAIQGRIQVFGAHAQLAQGFHLVLHQRDQR